MAKPDLFYYCLSLMESIERRTGKLLNETHPDLENDFWQRRDSKRPLSPWIARATKIIDELEKL